MGILPCFNKRALCALALCGIIAATACAGESPAGVTLWDPLGDGLQGWAQPSRIEPRAEDGRLILSVTGRDAWIRREGLQLDPASVETIAIRYRATAFEVQSTHGEIFYQNDAHCFADRNYITVPSLILDGDWHDLLLNVRACLRCPVEDWLSNGPVTALRLDLVNEAPGVIEIESITAGPLLRRIARDDVAIDSTRAYLIMTDSFRTVAPGHYERALRLPDGAYALWAHLVDAPRGHALLAGLAVSQGELLRPAAGDSFAQTWLRAGSLPGGEVTFTLDQPPSVFFDALLIVDGDSAPHDKPPEPLRAVESMIEPRVSAPEAILRPYWTGDMLALPGRAGRDAETGHDLGCFRRTFEAPANLESAWLQVAVDDLYRLYVNGEKIEERIDRSGWTEPALLDVTDRLNRGGMNCVAIEGMNLSGPAGVLVDLTLNLADHAHQKIVSNEEWRCAPEAAEGWTQADFDDTAWDVPKAQPGPPTAPWTARIPYHDMTWQTPTECVACDLRDVVHTGQEQQVTLQFRSDKPVAPGEVLGLRLVNTATDAAVVTRDFVLAVEHCGDVGSGTIAISGIEIPISRWLPSMTLRLDIEICGRAMTLPPEAARTFTYDNAKPVIALTSDVRVVDGAPRLFVNGAPMYPLVGNGEGRGRSGTKESYKAAGFNIEANWIDGMGSEQWWVGPGEYRFEPVDTKIAADLDYNPEVLMLPIIWAAPPLWWQDAHPDEIARFNDGTTWGYYRGTASFSSEQWKCDAAAALTAFVEHVESMPYASRILGYWIIGGVSAEWQGWGCHASNVHNHLMDYSAAAQEAFRSFLLQKHGGVPGDYADVSVPTFEERLGRELGVFRDPGAAQPSIDYTEFYSESVVDALLHCAHAAKTAVQRGKIVGVYFGYSLEYTNMSWALQMSGHNRLRKALDSPDVDFFSAPPSYAVRRLGEPAGWMWPFRSMQYAGKLVWVDDDTRTFLAGAPCSYSPMVNLEQTRAALRRNFGTVLCRLCPAGFLQINSGRELDHPAIARDIRAIKRAGEYALDRHVQRNVEIAVVVDEDSVKYLAHDGERLESGEVDRIVHWNGNVTPSARRVNTLMGDLVSYQRGRLERIGAPVDYMLLSDLVRHDTDYKLYIMLSCFQYDEATRAAIRQRLYQRPVTVVWCYAPGFIHDGVADVSNMERLTGLRFDIIREPASPKISLVDLAHPIAAGVRTASFGVDYAFAPLFHVVDDAATPIGIYRANGLVALAAKDVGAAHVVFCGSNKMSAEVLHGFARAAGVHLYSDSLDPFEANGHFVMLHASRGGDKTFQLKRPSDVVDVFDRRVLFEQVSRFTVPVAAQQTRLFFVGDSAGFLEFMESQRGD